MRWPRGLRALRHRDYRLLFGAQSLSLVGTWMQGVAQSWLVLQLTDSPFKLGLIGAIQFGPMLALSLVAGALADRLPKRRLLIATQTVLTLQSLVMAGLVGSGHVAYWHVCALALVAGVVNTLEMPARQSFVAQLVGADDLMSAVSLNSAAFNGARIVGPAVAGLLIARVGLAPAFLLNALSFPIVIAALLMVRAEGPPGTRRGSTLLEEILAGFAYARRAPGVRFILTLLFIVSLCVFNFSVFVPLLARDVLNQGAQGFGLLMASLGVGAVTGALTLGALGRREPPRLAIIAAGGGACLGMIALAGVRHFGVAIAVLFAVGVSAIVAVASCNTSLQLHTPDELRGRVMSLYTLISGGTFPFGSLAVGAISERWGIPAALLAAGGVGLLGIAALAARETRGRLR